VVKSGKKGNAGPANPTRTSSLTHCGQLHNALTNLPNNLGLRGISPFKKNMLVYLGSGQSHFSKSASDCTGKRSSRSTSLMSRTHIRIPTAFTSMTRQREPLQKTHLTWNKAYHPLLLLGLLQFAQFGMKDLTLFLNDKNN